MNKFYLSILLCFAYGFTFGQATLTTANLGVVGDNAGMIKTDTAGFDPGAAGTGVTWDFSGLSATTDTTWWNYITPPAGPLSGSDICISDGPNFYFYDTSAAGDTLYKVGEQDSLFTLENPASYTNSEIYFDYPYTTGSSNTDDFVGGFEVLFGIIAAREGSDTSEVDGSGTLILPDGRSFDDVIRIKRHIVWQDSGSGFGYTILNTYDYTNYEWWDQDGKFPLMSSSERVFTAFTAPGYEYHVSFRAEMAVDTTDTTDTTTAIRPFINENLGRLDVFPNPMEESGTVSFELVKPGDIRLSLIDLQGRTVAELYQGYKMNGIHRLDFDPTQHTKGIYFLRLSNAEAAVHRKIIIE